MAVPLPFAYPLANSSKIFLCLQFRRVAVQFIDMAEKPRVAILASGSGSTAEAFIEAAVEGIVEADIAVVVCNNPPEKAGVYERIKRLNVLHRLDIEVQHISGRTHPQYPGGPGEQTIQEANAISTLLGSRDVKLGLLMGYMKRVRGSLLSWPLLNTHPGILPQTQGLYGIHVQEHVLHLGMRETAHTVHEVIADYDKGTIVAEHRLPVLRGDTPQRLFERVQRVEKAMFPIDVDAYLKSH